MQAILWNSQPVMAGMDTHLQRHQNFAQGSADTVETVSEVAALCASAGDDGKVAELRTALVALLEARRASQLHAAALQEMKGSYEASVETTDFKQRLEQRAQQLAAQQPYNVQADPLLREFDAVAAGEGGAGAGGAEQIDDDIEIEGGAHSLAPNALCPLSAKPIMEIKDPVQDSQGVVYEREFVVAFFRTLPPSKHGRASIMAGSSHQVTLAELVPAERVIKEKKRMARRARFGGGSATQGAAEDVLDV